MQARTDHPHYEILEPLGEGGMGVVFKARDKRLNRIVALKFLAPDQARRNDALRRFEREALAIAALNHPNIAVVYEAGEWDGSPFLALEYLPGGTLKNRCRGRKLSEAELLHYAAQVGRGLAYAHEQGILHRDIKSGNVMFSEHGDLKIVDFGLAKWRNAEDATRTGAMVGTIPYMAPELLDGEPATVQTELYSFGALIYELAAGQPMFGGERTETLIRRIVTGEVTPLESLRPDLSPRITAAIKRATERDPKDRYASVREFMRDLGSGSTGSQGELSQQETLTMPLPLTRTKANKRKKFLTYGVGTVLALAALTGTTLWFHRPALKTVVVMPFENIDQDTETQTFADGLQETITDTLAEAGTLRSSMLVVPTEEDRRNQIKSIADARKQLGADLVIGGNVKKTPEAVRLTLNVADAASSRQEAMRVMEVRPEEVQALQERLGEELGALLNTGPVTRGNIPGETTHNSSAYKYYVQGKGALQTHDWDQASEVLRKAVELDPQFTAARASLSESYLRKYLSTQDTKFLALADAEVAEAAKQARNPDVAFVQAMIWRVTGQADRAIPLFREILQTDPDNLEVRNRLGQALEAAGRLPEAEAAYQAAVRQRPGYWLTYQVLGTFYFKQHQYTKAEQAYSTGLAVAPQIPALHSNLGAVYFEMARWDDAAREFQKSIALRPYALGYSNLGTVRFYEGRFQEAAQQFEEATKLQEANPINWGNLGDARWQIAGERENALKAFEKGASLASEHLALNPNDVGIRKCYALYLAKLDRPKEAAEQAEAALSAVPKDPDVLYWAARVYAVLGQTSRAEALLTAALAHGYDSRSLEREPDLKSIAARIKLPAGKQ